MTENRSPRQIVKQVLQGIPPSRPLFLPIVFSFGARLENVPLRTFLADPTKISSALRQIRGYLRSDGVTCYYDPYLEAEALGGILEWHASDRWPTLSWPRGAAKGQIPESLRSPEDALKRGRVAVAIEVIRRLKSTLRDDTLLMAAVTGPLTLAARISQLEGDDSLRFEQLPDAALGIAAELMMRTAAAFVEAGANLIFIEEAVLPPLATESCEAWASRLAPTVNIIRFYEALPVLQITNHRLFAENSEVVFGQHWDCVVCPTLEKPLRTFANSPQTKDLTLGVALPLNVLEGDYADEDLHDFLDEVITGTTSGIRPAIITTAGDVPRETEMKSLVKVSARIRRDEAT